MDEETRRQFESYLAMLGANTLTGYLDFGARVAGDAEAVALAKALEGNTTLTELGLSENLITDVGAVALAEALEGNRTLIKLYLAKNQIGPAGAAALAKALEGNGTVTEVALPENKIGDAGAESLAKALEVNTALTKLHLYECEIGPAGAVALAGALEVNEILIKLYLNENKIGPAGAKALAQALQRNRALTELNLDDNEIGDAGAKALAQALDKNQTLTELNLDDNRIGDVGAAALAEVLKENKTLTTLSLQFNYIGDDGAAALAQALEKNQTLTELNLDDNEIGDAGAKALAEALKVKTAPISLYLGGDIKTTSVGILKDGNKTTDVGKVAIDLGLQHLQANIKMLESRHQIAKSLHFLNRASTELGVKMPEEIWGVVVNFLVSMLATGRGIDMGAKKNVIKMGTLVDIPDDYASTSVVAEAFKAFEQDIERHPEHFVNAYYTHGVEGVEPGVKGVVPICRSDSVLLERFGQLQDYDVKLKDGIVSFKYNEQGEKVPTAKEFNILKVNLDSLSRMLTKDVVKTDEEREYKTNADQKVEVPGLDFAQIVATRQPILLLNIFTIAKDMPSLMTAFEEKMQANNSALLKTVAEMIKDPKYQNLQSQLSQIVDRVGKITQIDDDEAVISEGGAAAAYGVTDNMTTASTTAPAFVGTGVSTTAPATAPAFVGTGESTTTPTNTTTAPAFVRTGAPTTAPTTTSDLEHFSHNLSALASCSSSSSQGSR